jgi:hypothetical protein
MLVKLLEKRRREEVQKVKPPLANRNITMSTQHKLHSLPETAVGEGCIWPFVRLWDKGGLYRAPVALILPIFILVYIGDQSTLFITDVLL